MIFKICDSINNKVFNMIIDSGSSKNIVSKALINIIRLSTQKHVAPYKIWLIKKNDKNTIYRSLSYLFHYLKDL